MSNPAISPSQDPAPREIRRYSNRKLYDTAERRFTSLSAIENLVRNGIDFVVVDHDMESILRISRRLVVMARGSKIADGEPAAVRADQGVLAAYAGL